MLSRPQGHSAIGRISYQWKIPLTPAGIEPATFRFVAQHLNHCATAVPHKVQGTFRNSRFNSDNHDSINYYSLVRLCNSWCRAWSFSVTPFHLLLSWTKVFQHHPPSIFLVFPLASLKWVSRSVLVWTFLFLAFFLYDHSFLAFALCRIILYTAVFFSIHFSLPSFPPLFLVMLFFSTCL